MNNSNLNQSIDPLPGLIRSINFYYPIVLSVIATASNLVSFVIFSSRSFRTNPTGLVLKLKSLVDIGNVYAGTLRFVYLSTTNSDLLNTSALACLALITLVYSIDAFSSWLNVIVSLDRLFLVLRPSAYHSISHATLRRTHIYAAALALTLILIVNLTKLSQIEYLSVRAGNLTSYRCTALNQSLVDWINFTITLVVPFAIMSLSSSTLVYYLLKKSSHTRGHHKSAMFVKTVVILDICFLAFNLPRFVLQLNRSSGSLYSLLLQLSAVLKYSLNATTLLLWLVTNNIFRARLSGMFTEASNRLSQRRQLQRMRRLRERSTRVRPQQTATQTKTDDKIRPKY